MTFPAPGSHLGMSGIPVAVFMLLLAGFFLYGPDLNELPESRASVVNTAHLSTQPPRQALGDPPTVRLHGFERTCMDCHKLFPPRLNPPEQLQVHADVVLDHGINDQCRNCHDLQDRDRLVLRNGRTISFDESVVLCAKCHGPTFRDWQRGMHGRSSGFWNPTLGSLDRLNCVECHDPHQPTIPAMLPIRPMPGPHTLRMGEQPEEHHGAIESDPLRKAILRRTGQ